MGITELQFSTNKKKENIIISTNSLPLYVSHQKCHLSKNHEQFLLNSRDYTPEA